VFGVGSLQTTDPYTFGAGVTASGACFDEDAVIVKYLP
jgi:hypothetical protein